MLADHEMIVILGSPLTVTRNERIHLLLGHLGVQGYLEALVNT